MYFDNEEEKKAQNQEDEEQLIKDMALYGYKEYGTEFFNTKSYENLVIDFIKNKIIRIYNYNLPPKTTKVIRQNANRILVSKTENVDKKVLYIPNDEQVFYDFTAKYGEIDETNYDKLLKFIKKRAKKREVTSLPINWATSNFRNGFYMSLGLQGEDISLIQKLPIISVGIQMINQNDDLGSTVLTHEMTHALVDRFKGIVENGCHNELLSIYMELITALELDESEHLLNIAILNRLQNLKNNILEFQKNCYNGYEINREDDYIDSSLYAFGLFEKYRKSRYKSRIAITNEINQTLSGNRTLEETLQKLNVTEEEGSKIIRKYIRRLM